MKKFHFITQSKGGVGKSLLMYLFALKYGHKKDSLFVDLDSSTESSKSQLSFIDPDNFDMVSLSDEKEALVRDQLVSYLEELSLSSFQEVYFDMGAPESAQLPALIRYDLPMKEFADELGFEMVFHVVIAGGTAYKPSVSYLTQLVQTTAADFKIIVWKSITSFRKFPELSDELEANCRKMNLEFRQFGDFEPESELGGKILDGARLGFGLKDYQTGPRMKLKAQLQMHFSHE
jgi:cellulose biosynthesis protein BcsQ